MREIIFDLLFQSLSDYNNLYIDLGIYNNKEQMILHTKAKFNSTPFNVKMNDEFIINYFIKCPNLAPGDYYLTIYAYNLDKFYLNKTNIFILYFNLLLRYRLNVQKYKRRLRLALFSFQFQKNLLF